MKRPSPWQLNDFLSFAGIALLMTLGATATTVWGEGSRLGEAIALFWVVAGVAWFIYFLLVWSRWKYIQRFDVVLDYGIMVMRNGYLISSIELGAELDRFVRAFEPHFRVRRLLVKDRIWVVFHPGMIENQGGYEKVAGFVRVGGNVAHVAYFRRVKDDVFVKDPSVPIEKTAFFHELGHIVLGRAWGSWDPDEHHTWMRKNVN